MKNSIRTHAARLSAWQSRQARGRRGRTKAFRAKKDRTLRHERVALYRALMHDRHGQVREKGHVIRERAATRAPFSKPRRRRLNKIAAASRRRNR